MPLAGWCCTDVLKWRVWLENSQSKARYALGSMPPTPAAPSTLPQAPPDKGRGTESRTYGCAGTIHVRGFRRGNTHVWDA